MPITFVITDGGCERGSKRYGETPRSSISSGLALSSVRLCQGGYHIVESFFVGWIQSRVSHFSHRLEGTKRLEAGVCSSVRVTSWKLGAKVASSLLENQIGEAVEAPTSG